MHPDAANLDQGNICTAGDVKTSQFNVVGTAPKSCTAGEPLLLALEAVTLCGSQSRFDIGFYVCAGRWRTPRRVEVSASATISIRSPRTTWIRISTARSTTIPRSPTAPTDCGPYYNAEVGLDDSCGDIQQNLSSLFILNHGAPIAFTCTDRDGDGHADVGPASPGGTGRRRLLRRARHHSR
jgi:hypothetical protein